MAFTHDTDGDRLHRATHGLGGHKIADHHSDQGHHDVEDPGLGGTVRGQRLYGEHSRDGPRQKGAHEEKETQIQVQEEQKHSEENEIPEEEKETPFVDGMNKIYRQLLSVFEGMGVKAIESVGQEFNPDYHNAVMHVEDEEAGENVVVEEFQKGYTYKDTVIRHSMVKVAN